MTNDPKKSWKLLNNFLLSNRAKINIHRIDIDNKTILEPLIIANHFNNYFCSKVEKLLCDFYGPAVLNMCSSFDESCLLLPFTEISIVETFSFQQVTYESLLPLVNKIKNSSNLSSLPKKFIDLNSHDVNTFFSQIAKHDV